MFYTAVNSEGRGVKDQRLGVAASEDLTTWERLGSAPVVSPDPRWYKTLDGGPGPSETWRDPLVLEDPDGDGWHMIVCARAVGADKNDDGVLAHAHSADLRSWELGPPLCEPGAGFGQLEVAQVNIVDGVPMLVFTCHPQEQTDDRIAVSGGEFCTWSVAGDPGGSLLGPWDITRAEPFRAEPDLFAAPFLRDRSGQWVFVGFRNTEPKGVLAFDILDPIPVRRFGGSLLLAL
jgi:beta-fructofuranosidase